MPNWFGYSRRKAETARKNKPGDGDFAMDDNNGETRGIPEKPKPNVIVVGKDTYVLYMVYVVYVVRRVYLVSEKNLPLLPRKKNSLWFFFLDT